MASLVITPVTGAPLTFDCVPGGAKILDNSPTVITGLESQNLVTFFFDTHTRDRLTDLEPIVGHKVRQTRNRSGKIQLTSEKPCAFVKCVWDAPRNKLYSGWNEIYRYSEMEGVLEVTSAAAQGLTRNMTLTLYRGDWLYKADGTIERFT